MGFYDNLKKGAKGMADNYKKNSADNKKYNQELKDKVKKARREEFSKEAEKQARIRAKLNAQRRYNPSPQQQRVGGGMTDDARKILYGLGSFGSPAQRVEQKINKPKKKKKSTQQRVVYVIQEQAKKKKKKKKVKKIQTPIRSELDKLLYG